MDKHKKNYLKFFLGLFLCLFARLIPFRAPNIEPLLATLMPFGKVYGAFAGFSFGALSILLYDVLTHTLGAQTFFTVSAYGLLGVFAAFYFRKRESKIMNYVTFAVFGTLFFDAMTGLTVGPIVFHQTFSSALYGQVPFTALHLFGNIIFAIILSPAIYNVVAKNKKPAGVPAMNIINPKAI